MSSFPRKKRGFAAVCRSSGATWTEPGPSAKHAVRNSTFCSTLSNYQHSHLLSSFHPHGGEGFAKSRRPSRSISIVINKDLVQGRKDPRRSNRLTFVVIA